MKINFFRPKARFVFGRDATQEMDAFNSKTWSLQRNETPYNA